jgi:hypothetical protein
MFDYETSYYQIDFVLFVGIFNAKIEFSRMGF